MQTKQYFLDLKEQVDKNYAMANQARALGLDPKEFVEIPLAMSMAEKVVGLISTIYPQMQGSGIAKRILELEEKHGKLDSTIVFQIGDEVAHEKFCKFENTLQAIDAGIRVGFAYITLGVVSSPIEGYTGIKTRLTREGKEYLEASFSGPIRSAGTTASVICLMLIDYLRERFGYAKYDPTEEEIKRVWAELEHFHDRITNLQYMPLEEEALFLAKNMPIQVAGDASEKLEVPNYKNLERVDTDFLRSGFCLVMAEALAQKAAKGFRLLNNAKKNGINANGFDWISEYVELHEKLTSAEGKKEKDTVPVYIKDLVAGRPVFGHPSAPGSFRIRYGRGRNSGFSASSLHPATMAVSDGFIATGTQLKIEKPTKGCAITVCDSIEGPIVKLKNGSVRKLHTHEEGKKLYKEIEEIIYFGDLLFPFSDFLNRNADLTKSGYVEEWWKLDLRKASKGKETINPFDINFEKAIEFSEKYKIPLHPEFIFYWTQINKKNFQDLLEWLRYSWVDGKIIFPYNKTEQERFELGKRTLELLGIEHEVTIENVVMNNKDSKALLLDLGLDFDLINKKEKTFLKDYIDCLGFSDNEEVLDMINSVCKFKIKDKAGDFIGTRMGRPEKGKLRKLTGSPNVLFPVGNEGGRLRSVQTACEAGKVRSTFPLNYCKKCKKETIYPSCEVCHEKTTQMYYFYETKEKSFNSEEKHLEKKGTPFQTINLDVVHYYKKAVEKLKLERDEEPVLIKGVRGTTSGNKIMEHLAKGFLRAKHDLQVNKDGTIRFDATELPLMYFKPKEVSVSVEKLKEFGYDVDIFGKPLEEGNQILELMPHDVLLPSCPDSMDEKADDVFIKICKFIDEELERFYGLKKFYNVKTKEDLIGKLGVCMAPHNCAGVVCRFIGFSQSQGLFASPYMHAAIRRDCDGDEAAVMLLGDVLLNFSREFLPSHRGGTQDAPLVLNAKIDAGEVDDQILDLEMCCEYPLELYELAEQRKHSSEVKNIPLVKDSLNRREDPFRGVGFTHNTDNINDGVLCSSYKLLGTMQDKVRHQMELVEKIRAVDTSDTARLVIERHFMRDMKGNLRKFSQQDFRCVKCNHIMRRPPLNGVCPMCRGKIIFTIHEGGIKKYLEPALDLAKKYNLSPYLQQSLQLVKGYIDSIFGKELEKQTGLTDYF
jgi:DNA polymerase II large subunit